MCSMLPQILNVNFVFLFHYRTNVLPRYVNKHITITLPEGKTLQNIRWFSVWCDEFAVNFGDVRISKNLDFPRPQKIGALNGVHGVSSDQVVIVDAQTLLIPSFSYDGEAPGNFLYRPFFFASF